MKHGPTLIDTLYRASFQNKKVMNWKNNAVMRERLVNARRFILDDAMSSFLGDLATTTFTQKVAVPSRDWALAWKARMVENVRVSARAPHAITWVEFNLRKMLGRSAELMGKPFKPEQHPLTEGWLIEQHPKLDDAFTLHIFSREPEVLDESGSDTWTFPVCYGWRTGNDPFPWHTTHTYERPDGRGRGPVSEIICGLVNYDSKQLGVIESPLIDTPFGKEKWVRDLVMEWMGCMRRVWTLLATVDDIPVLRRDVVQAKGFVAKGRYRKFLAHTTLTLHVPQKVDLHKLARKVVAIARRRAHQVRGHHRLDWRNPPAPHCEHEWKPSGKHLICQRCQGHKIFISEHQRGDASLGFVTHDYKLTHEKENYDA